MCTCVGYFTKKAGDRMRTLLVSVVFAVGCTEAPEFEVQSVLNPLSYEAVDDATELTYVREPSKGAGVHCSEGICTSHVPISRSNVSAGQLAEEMAVQNEFAGASPGTLLWEQYVGADVALENKYLVLEHALRIVEEDEDQFVRFKVRLFEPKSEPLPENGRGASRDTFVRLRKKACDPSQDLMEAHILGLGGVVAKRRWLTNSMHVMVPAKAVQAVLDHPLVFGAYLESSIQSDYGGDGLDRALATTGNPIWIPEGGGGTGGSGPAGQIVFGVVENDNSINVTHKGFKLNAGGGSRILSTDDCGFFTCDGNAAGQSASHGTTVTSVLLGQVFGADFPGWNGTELAKRTALAKTSVVRYYRATIGSPSISNAIEQAVEDGVDILNFSWSSPVGCEELCNVSYDAWGMRDEITAAHNAGIVIVASAGNCGTQSSCTTKFPGILNRVISSAGINDTIVFSGGYAIGDNPDQYLHPGSSRGFRQTVNNAGENIAVPTIGLTGYYVVRLHYTGGTTGFASFPSVAASGNSFSSPLIASIGGLTRQWLSGFGSIANAAWATQINMLLMGDGRCGVDCPSYALVDSSFGYGMPKFFEPTVNYLGTTFGWGTRSDTISQGEVVQWTVNTAGPEPTSVTGWKWALAIDTGAITGYPKLSVSVVDTCPPGGGTQVVRTALNQGLRYRVILQNGPNLIHNRCLEMRVVGTKVIGGPIPFWSADMYFSVPVANHVYIP